MSRGIAIEAGRGKAAGCARMGVVRREAAGAVWVGVKAGWPVELLIFIGSRN